MSATDADLLTRAARGDATAFPMLYDRHWLAVYRFAWLLTNSVQDAEDITQECFLALVRKASSFDPVRSQLRTWLIAVARKEYLRRRQTGSREDSLMPMDTLDQAPAAEAELIRLEIADAVRHAVSALPEAQREALFLFEFEGMSLSEAAAILEIEPNAVKARLFRAREQLKRLLEPLRPHSSPRKEQPDAR